MCHQQFSSHWNTKNSSKAPNFTKNIEKD
jgi:hypothetical protein